MTETSEPFRMRTKALFCRCSTFWLECFQEGLLDTAQDPRTGKCGIEVFEEHRPRKRPAEKAHLMKIIRVE